MNGGGGGGAAAATAAAAIQYQKVTVAQEDGRAIEKMRRDVVLVRCQWRELETGGEG